MVGREEDLDKGKRHRKERDRKGQKERGERKRGRGLLGTQRRKGGRGEGEESESGQRK